MPGYQVDSPSVRIPLDGAIVGFGVKTGMHALRLMTSGTLECFLKLQVILGHMGEAERVFKL